MVNEQNLNLLGTREPGIYGLQTLAGVEELCRAEAAKYELEADCRQWTEGVLIDWIQEAGTRQAAGDLIGAVFNPGAYTHTSLALHDAIKGAKLRLIECHISNVHTREEFRSHSFISPAAAGIVVGFGVDGYAVAIHGLHLLSTAAVPALTTETAAWPGQALFSGVRALFGPRRRVRQPPGDGLPPAGRGGRTRWRRVIQAGRGWASPR